METLCRVLGSSLQDPKPSKVSNAGSAHRVEIWWCCLAATQILPGGRIFGLKDP